MIVVITSGGVQLADAEDLQRFHVAVEAGVDDADGVLRQAGFGHFDGEAEALIAVDALRRAAQRAGVGDDWEDRFAGMIAYARTKGWVSDDGSAIRGHVEKPQP